MINLRHMEAFLAVGEAGSFTAAARQLGRAQSAVSQAVRQLEEELGVLLFDRSARTVELTAAGVLLRSHATFLLEDIDRIAAIVRDQGGHRLPQLRFGMVDSFASAVGPALIKSLLDEAVNLSLWSDFTPRLGEALVQKRVDIVVAYDPFDNYSRLTRHLLAREPFVLLLPAGVPWNAQAPDLARLARSLPMVGYQPVSYMAGLIEARCHLLNAKPSRRVQVDSTDKLIAMVAAGIGWGISTPLSMARNVQRHPTLRVEPFPGELFERRLFLVSRRGEFDTLVERLSQTARRALADLVESEVRPRMPQVCEHLHVDP